PLFGKTDKKEQLRKLISELRRKKYSIDREAGALQTQKKKLENDIRIRAKNNRMDEVKILAKELVHMRKAVSRLYSAKAEIDTIISELNVQTATVKMTTCMKTSTVVMKAMSNLIKLPELRSTMQDLNKQLMHMDMIDSSMNETFDSTLGDSEDLEEATDLEVTKVISELTADISTNVPSVAPGSVSMNESVDDPQLDELRAQLNRLQE
ncbi:hypothetical protein EG68_08733, partial [Paragonimus skrjabini miyazakii]